jgi:sulfite reductase alpha subunit-like flavoprotein
VLHPQVEALGTSNVAVFYASAYGNTAALAQAISHGLTKSGMAVNTVNLEVASTDEVQQTIKSTNGFVIGSPTLGGHMPTQVQVRGCGRNTGSRKCAPWRSAQHRLTCTSEALVCG